MSQKGFFFYLQKLMLNFRRRGERQDKNSDQKIKIPEKGAAGQGIFPDTSSPGCVVLAACTEDTRRSETTGIHTLVVVVLCVAAGCAIVSLLLLCADVVWYTSYVSKEHDGALRLIVLYLGLVVLPAFVSFLASFLACSTH